MSAAFIAEGTATSTALLPQKKRNLDPRQKRNAYPPIKISRKQFLEIFVRSLKGSSDLETLGIEGLLRGSTRENSDFLQIYSYFRFFSVSFLIGECILTVLMGGIHLDCVKTNRRHQMQNHHKEATVHSGMD